MYLSTKLFIDTEFTNLTQNASLLSIALISETDHQFYAEFTDYGKDDISDFVRENVLPKMFLKEDCLDEYQHGKRVRLCGTKQAVTEGLKKWLSQFGDIESSIQIWGNCIAYDWVLFCELFGGSLSLPKQIHYMPMDISVFFQMKTGNPDMDMEKFVGDEYIESDAKLHNALYDAQLTKACYQKLIKM